MTITNMIITIQTGSITQKRTPKRVPTRRGAITTVMTYQSTTGLLANGCLLLKPTNTLIVQPKNTSTEDVATLSMLQNYNINNIRGTNNTPPPMPLTAARQLIVNTNIKYNPSYQLNPSNMLFVLHYPPMQRYELLEQSLYYLQLF